MHYAVHRQIAAEVFYNRVDSEKPMIGMTNFKGNISHRQAVEKAEQEYDNYRQREMQQLESDFDRAVKQLLRKKDSNELQP